MSVLSNIWRLIRTGATLERTGAMGATLEAMGAPPAFRIFARVIMWPIKWVGLKGDPNLTPIVRALSVLGPAYVKFGQILSTRPDVVGDRAAQDLRFLQDKLPPFDTVIAKEMIAREFGTSCDALFDQFDDAIAAASIAQVHPAKLRGSGQKVAVKILRPGIEKAFATDVAAFYFIARTLEILLPKKMRRLRPTDVIAHFEATVKAELDLRLEAAAASEFASNTAKDDGFWIPKIHWNTSGKRVMTMDWAEGVAMGDNAALEAAGHDRKDLATRVLQLFLRHALRDGLFHADMHQGNLKVAPNGDIIALDFGIMGQIDLYTRRVYAQILHGFIQRDYMRVAKVHFEAGYVPADRDVAEFARALRAVGEPIFGMDASAISMGRLLYYLFEVTERFGMETRTELILLQRTMVVVEGVARSLDPNVNMWNVAEPVVKDYVANSIGPRAVLQDLTSTGQVLLRFGPRLPDLVEKALIRAEQADAPAPPVSSGRPAIWLGIGALLGSGSVALIWHLI